MDNVNNVQVQERLKSIRAKDIMSKFAVTARDDEELLDVAHQMIKLRISGLPVTSAVGKIVGIITVTDLFKVMGTTPDQLGSQYQLNEKSIIRDVMTKDVRTIDKDTNLFDIILTMQGKNIHTLPVVDGDLIIGIVGRRDVIYAYYSLFMD